MTTDTFINSHGRHSAAKNTIAGGPVLKGWHKNTSPKRPWLTGGGEKNTPGYVNNSSGSSNSSSNIQLTTMPIKV